MQELREIFVKEVNFVLIHF